MSLADSLQREASVRLGPRCTICILVAGMTPEDVAILEEAFADQRFTSAAITRALQAEGHKVAAHAISRHRRGECAQR